MTEVKATPAMTLEWAIFVEDAIEAIGSKTYRSQYIGLYDGRSKADAEAAFDEAQRIIGKCGTVRKALNSIRKVIDSYR